ncbi:MAG: hypothetical protein M3R23_06470, partial [Actinomycetota bacterium]|nr:hypothetical protein [Actinomycetota bacterium]
VENEVQLAELRRLGCGFAQGFLFSGPLQVREMTALLERAAAGSPFSRMRPSAASADAAPDLASESRAWQGRRETE